MEYRSDRRSFRVKLIMGMLASTRKDLKRAHTLVQEHLGALDLQSDIIAFDYTDYYNSEMGDAIIRQFVSFESLIDPGDLWEMKVRTNRLENAERIGGRRLMNLDPGYLTQCNVVLATTKEAGHRVYIANGIYGQPILYYKKNGFVPFEFTYADYADENNRAFFDDVRDLYREQLKDHHDARHGLESEHEHA